MKVKTMALLAAACLAVSVSTTASASYELKKNEIIVECEGKNHRGNFVVKNKMKFKACGQSFVFTKHSNGSMTVKGEGLEWNNFTLPEGFWTSSRRFFIYYPSTKTIEAGFF
jgi:hypothetical protein